MPDPDSDPTSNSNSNKKEEEEEADKSTSSEEESSSSEEEESSSSEEESSSSEESYHVQWGKDILYDQPGPGMTTMDQEWWDINEIGDELATHIRLARKYGTPIEFRGMEPITEPASRKTFRKEYVSGVVGKYLKLKKRKAKMKGVEKVDVPALLQRFASKHAQQSALHARAMADTDAKDAEVIFADSIDEIAPLLG